MLVRRNANAQEQIARSGGAGLPQRSAAVTVAGLCLVLSLGFSLGTLTQRARTGQSARARPTPLPRRDMGDSAVLRRLCQAIVCEFSQPLSGVLAYSELLMQHTVSSDDAQRFELRGLREGALHLERLLLSVREAARAGVQLDDSYRLADRVEQAIGQARAYTPIQIA
jgi:signal transduction histidine kinase